MFFFFFQAEDGIRDLTVTGVQTCALPISDAFSVWAPKVPRDTATRTLIRSLCNLANGKCPFFDNEQALYGQHPLSVETDASVTGGNDQTSYYPSGLVNNDRGIGPKTRSQK